MHDVTIALQEQREEEMLRELAEDDIDRVSGGYTAELKCIWPDPDHPINCDPFP